MKYITLIFTSFLLSAPFALSGQTTGRVMSLDELFALADTQSKSTKIFESAVTGAEKDISVAKNAYLPTVDFSASATYNGNAWVSDRDFSNGQTFASPHFGNSFSIEASQVIFAGGSIHHQVKALEAQQKIAEWDLAAHRQEVYFLLTGYYLDLYKYRNLLTVYDRNIEQTLQVIRDMRAREAAGVALDNDITRYEVQYQNLQYKRTELVSSIEIYNDKLVTMLDLPSQTEIYPDTTLLHGSIPQADENDFQEQAFQCAPLLNKNRLTIDWLTRKRKVAQAGYMPQISLIAGDNLNGPITYEIPVLDNNINVWYVGVQPGQPLQDTQRGIAVTRIDRAGPIPALLGRRTGDPGCTRSLHPLSRLVRTAEDAGEEPATRHPELRGHRQPLCQRPGAGHRPGGCRQPEALGRGAICKRPNQHHLQLLPAPVCRRCHTPHKQIKRV